MEEIVMIMAFPKDGSMDFISVDENEIPDMYTVKIPSSKYDVWDEEAQEWVFSIEKKSSFIGKHIYYYYTRDKQSQDRGYQAYAQAVIVGVASQMATPVTLDALTIEIMGAVLQIHDGNLTLADYVGTKADELQEHYAKLVKIGSRLRWAKMCADEGKLALVEEREPKYAEYPKL